MLKKLFEDGYLDLDKLVLDKYTSLNLQAVDAVVLIKMLNLYKQGKKIRLSAIVKETQLPRPTVENSLINLQNNNIYKNEMISNENGVFEEKVNLDSFFALVESLYKEETRLASLGSLQETVNMYESEKGTPVTPQELSILEGFINNDGFTVQDINKAIIEAVKANKVTLKFIEGVLFKGRSKSLSSDQKEKSSSLNKLYNMF